MISSYFCKTSRANNFTSEVKLYIVLFEPLFNEDIYLIYDDVKSMPLVYIRNMFGGKIFDNI